MSTISKSTSLTSETIQASLTSKQQLSGKIDSIQTLSAVLSYGSSGVANVYTQTTEEWNAQLNLIAKKNCIYVYSDYMTESDEVGNVTYIPGLKIGDGTSYLIDLPFIGGNIRDVMDTLNDHIKNTIIHVSLQDRVNWDGKVQARVRDNDNLVFS